MLLADVELFAASAIPARFSVEKAEHDPYAVHEDCALCLGTRCCRFAGDQLEPSKRWIPFQIDKERAAPCSLPRTNANFGQRETRIELGLHQPKPLSLRKRNLQIALRLGRFSRSRVHPRGTDYKAESYDRVFVPGEEWLRASRAEMSFSTPSDDLEAVAKAAELQPDLVLLDIGE